MSKTILVTGASGFIGSFIIEEGLRLGHDMWAGMRKTSSKSYLSDPRTHFAELDLSNPQRLQQQLLAYKEQMGGKGWDYVVHAAGATKSLHEEGFFRVNTQGTIHLVEALRATGMVPRRFVFVSSLSIFGAIREQPVRKPSPGNPWIYHPIMRTDEPRPNTAYGRSKLEAEHYLRAQQDFPYTILRPTGVYGPREKDYFLMAKSIVGHVDFAVGYRPQEITFVYVMDVVQAVFKCMDAPAALGKAYFLSDGQVYNSRTYSDLLQKHLGNPWLLRIKAPLWLLRIICAFGTLAARITGRMSALNNDEYHILRQRNWQCETAPASKDFGYEPQWDLERGVAASLQWYRQQGWL